MNGGPAVPVWIVPDEDLKKNGGSWAVSGQPAIPITGGSGGPVAWADITDKPTTIDGYGLTAEIAALIAPYLTQAAGDTRYGQLGAANTWALAQTFTGQVLASAGTVGAPGLSFSGDPNTGLVGSGDTLQLVAGGSSRMNLTTTTVQMFLPFWATISDSTVGSVTQVGQFRHNTSNTPANGFGSLLTWQLQSSTTANQNAAALEVLWNDATHASRKADMVFSAYDAGGAREFLRGRGNGSAAAIGFLGAGPVARQTVTGSRGGNAALASLITALATLGLITDSTS